MNSLDLNQERSGRVSRKFKQTSRQRPRQRILTTEVFIQSQRNEKFVVLRGVFNAFLVLAGTLSGSFPQFRDYVGTLNVKRFQICKC